MPTQTGQAARRSFAHAHITGVALAALLPLLAGTSVALAQSAKGKGKQPASNGPSTHTVTNEAPQVSTPQPSMSSAIDGARQGPGSTVAVPKSAQHKNAKADAAKVRIDDNSIVDLHVVDEDLTAVLEMLSLQSQRNIVSSKNVSAKVTANLFGVTFYETLDAILNVNGYGYIEDGNFIYVYTLDEIAAIEKANKQRVSKPLVLNYLSAVDAAEFVKPLLSEGGQIKTNGKMAGFPSLGDVPVGNEEYALAATLVIYDYEENVAEIEALIKQIDTRPSQVLIEATILQTQLNEANAFGVDFAVVANMDFGDFVTIGGPLVGPNALIGGKANGKPLPEDRGGTALSSNVGNTAGPGGFKVGVVSNDVAVFMRMLDEVTDSTVLSNPKLLALNRQAARVLVGRKVGYLSTTSTDTATTQTVEFLDTGTQLYVRPIVAPDGMIRMELKPQVSEAVIRDVKDATGAAVTVPDEITNELTTNVIVRDGQTIVLGGLFRESTVATRRQIPVLGDIPLIGSAFRGNDDTTERSEIIFLITPTVVNDTAMADAGKAGQAYVDNARAGAREGTLKWSRDRLTGQLNIEAEKLASEGNNEKALWKVERSLRLNAAQPEAVALRERLTGVKSPLGNQRSMLERIIHSEAAKSTGKSASAVGEPSRGVTVTPAWIDDTTTAQATPTATTTGGDAATNTTTTSTTTADASQTPTMEQTGAESTTTQTGQPAQTTADATTTPGGAAADTQGPTGQTQVSPDAGTASGQEPTGTTTTGTTGQVSTPDATTTPKTPEATPDARIGTVEPTAPNFGLAESLKQQEAAANPAGAAPVAELAAQAGQPTEYARLWFSPGAIFGPMWTRFDRIGRTPTNTPATPATPVTTVTHVDEQQPDQQK
ncbi:MAG: hypothetical protein JSR77_10305 [Planctomycetes bacterium]|nr:hypothetical protein [Planctomycetota bacterium]